MLVISGVTAVAVVLNDFVGVLGNNDNAPSISLITLFIILLVFCVCAHFQITSIVIPLYRQCFLAGGLHTTHTNSYDTTSVPMPEPNVECFINDKWRQHHFTDIGQLNLPPHLFHQQQHSLPNVFQPWPHPGRKERGAPGVLHVK